MFPTTSMGLLAWDIGPDPYDHSQLSNNFKAIDQHTHEVGKGVQVPSGGIADGAVTTVKHADGSVTTQKIADGATTSVKLGDLAVTTTKINDAAVTSAKVADGAITAAKLDTTLIPIGQCILWYRADPTYPIPGGYWEMLDGRAWSSVVNKMNADGSQRNTGVMPDTRNAFPLGAALSGTGSGPASPPDIGSFGGSMTLNLAHVHAVASHVHTVPDHIHNVPNHVHGIGFDGAHNHGMHSRQTRTLRQDQTGNDSFLQTLYVAGFNSGGGDAVVPTDGVHAHGGATGGSGVFPTAGSGAFSTTGNTSTTDSQLGAATDIRPKFVGFCIFCRVR